MASKWQGLQQIWKRRRQASKPQWTLVILSHMIDTLAVCTENLKTSGCPHRHTHLHWPLMPRSQQQHSIALRSGGSTMKTVLRQVQVRGSHNGMNVFPNAVSWQRSSVFSPLQGQVRPRILISKRAFRC